MFERPKSGERAILVQVAVGGRLSQDQIEEFEELKERFEFLTKSHHLTIIR